MLVHQSDSNESWTTFENSMPSTVKTKLHRLNPPLPGDRIALDDHTKMDDLVSMTENWIKTSEGQIKIKQAAHVMLASLFFFESDDSGIIRAPERAGRFAAGRNQLAGSVRCRLPRNSSGLRKLLLEKADSLWCAVLDHDVVLGEQTNASNIFWDPITVPGRSEILSHCVNEEIGQCNVNLSWTLEDDPGSHRLQVIALKIKGCDKYIPISGFPSTLAALMERASARWLQ
ncbi:hypothetical protein OQA88_7038 [Cercophora sp. LCS_1]